MVNINTLAKHLKLSEYETATAIYSELLASEIAPDKIPGIIYRQGILDGRKEQRTSDTEKLKHRRAYYDQKKLEEGLANG